MRTTIPGFGFSAGAKRAAARGMKVSEISSEHATARQIVSATSLKMMIMVSRSETKSQDHTKIEVAVDATTARATCRAPSRAATGAGLPMPS